MHYQWLGVLSGFGNIFSSSKVISAANCSFKRAILHPESILKGMFTQITCNKKTFSQLVSGHVDGFGFICMGFEISMLVPVRCRVMLPSGLTSKYIELSF